MSEELPPPGEEILHPEDPNDACLVCGGPKDGKHIDHNYIDRRTFKHE